MATYDLVVIGTGPGGYVCAVRASQLGMKVAVVEKNATLGGTCLNVGCMPSKALLHASEMFEEAGHSFAKMGVSVSAPKLDLPSMMNFKQQGIDGNVKGVEFLMKKNKIDVLKGTGKILGTGKVEISADGKSQVIETRSIVIATGSDIARLKGIEIDETRIVSSTGALSLDKVPGKLLIVGAGVIGLELGSVWHRLGAEVVVVEFLDRILPGMDGEIAKQFQRILEKQGFAFKLGAKVTGVDTSGKMLKARVEPAAGGAAETLEADVVLVCIGRAPYTDGLGLKEAGVALDNRGRVQIDPHFATSVKGVYAIGDVVAGPMLAHKAEDEGVAVAGDHRRAGRSRELRCYPGRRVYHAGSVLRRQDRGGAEAGGRGLYGRKVSLYRQRPLQGQPDHRRLCEDSRRCEDRSRARRAHYRPRSRRNDP
ncbi:dihydrolipoamide dehydrogenase [Bradyrhizobium sp. LB1.3]